MMHMSLCKNFDFKINVILNESEKYTSFSINNKLLLIDTSQFLSSSLDSSITI